MARRFRLLIIVATLIGMSGCVWPSFRFSSDRTGFNPLERAIGPSNVRTLTPAWSVTTGNAPVADPVVSGDRVVVAAGQRLFAFDTAGKSAWSIDYGTTSDGTPFAAAEPTIAADAVFGGASGTAGGSSVGSTNKYDLATGGVLFSQTSSAAVASPAATSQYIYMPLHVGAASLWGAVTPGGTLAFISSFGLTGSPTVGGGTVFSEADGGQLQGGFDATGATCPMSHQIQLKICSPTWTATIGASLSTAAYTRTALFIGADDQHLYAFNPAGCGAATCPPLWNGATGGGVLSSPAVANATVYVGSGDGKLYAFPAQGCGAATCSPLWTMTTGGSIISSPAVANGVVYIGSDDGRLYAANAHGCGKPTCAPLWMSGPGAPIHSSPAVAAGTVYIGRNDGTLTAYRPKVRCSCG
jgi:outer membrane protein assembly factor BamB